MNSDFTNHNSTLPTTEGGTVVPDPNSEYLITVQIDDHYEGKLDADALHALARFVLQEEGRDGPLEIGIVVTTDAEVRALNKQYLDHDYDTDVISFTMDDEDEDDGFITPAERPRYLGDVVISYDRAAEQAPDYDLTTEQEVATLLVHGILHLLGWDDTNEEAHDKMHARQNELLEQFS